MAKLSKCKTCGYVFHEQDGSVCPECLTARYDNISSQASTTATPEYRNPVNLRTYQNSISPKRKALKSQSKVPLIFFFTFIIGFTILGSIISYSEKISSNYEDQEVQYAPANTIETDRTRYSFHNYTFGEAIKDNGLTYTYNYIKDLGNSYGGYTALEGHRLIGVNFSVINSSLKDKTFEIYQMFYGNYEEYQMLNFDNISSSIYDLEKGHSAELTAIYNYPIENEELYIMHYIPTGTDNTKGAVYRLFFQKSDIIING